MNHTLVTDMLHYIDMYFGGSMVHKSEQSCKQSYYNVGWPWAIFNEAMWL